MNPNRLCGTCTKTSAVYEIIVESLYTGNTVETFDICHECYDEMIWGQPNPD